MKSDSLALVRGKRDNHGNRNFWKLGNGLEAVVPLGLVTLLAGLDFLAGRDVVLAGIFPIGPCLAAAITRPRYVVVAGIYAVLLTLAVSELDRLWWTRQQLFFLLAIVGVTFVSTWIAKRREDQARLVIQAKEDEIRAVQANSAKSAFLSRMSHELRTPLAAIVGFAGILDEEQASLSSSHHEMVQRINRAGRHLMTLINDVLDISRVEMEQLSVSAESVVLTDAVKQGFDLVGSLCSEKSLGTTIDIDETLCVLADRSRLQQVLVNLLSNAAKYNRPSGLIEVTGSRDGQNARILVRDTGFGINTSLIDDLFTPFARLGAEQTRVAGTGLGLTLSKALAENMDGSLELISTGAQGTIFALTLPATDLTNENETSEPREPEGIFEQLRRTTASIVYIEDNPDNMRLFRKVLDRYPGMTVVEAENGTEGLSLVTDTRPDIVFLDLHLPGLDGRSVLAALKEDADTRDIPVVILTADAIGSSRQELVDLGASGYLTKPFASHDVVHLIADLLQSTP